jgi:hypothetical protein
MSRQLGARRRDGSAPGALPLAATGGVRCPVWDTCGRGGDPRGGARAPGRGHTSPWPCSTDSMSGRTANSRATRVSTAGNRSIRPRRARGREADPAARHGGALALRSHRRGVPLSAGRQLARPGTRATSPHSRGRLPIVVPLRDMRSLCTSDGMSRSCRGEGDDNPLRGVTVQACTPCALRVARREPCRDRATGHPRGCGAGAKTPHFQLSVFHVLSRLARALFSSRRGFPVIEHLAAQRRAVPAAGRVNMCTTARARRWP